MTCVTDSGVQSKAGWMDWRMDLSLRLSTAQDFQVEDQGQEHETPD